MKRTIYYTSLDEDVVFSRDQEFDIPDDYSWDKDGFGAGLLSRILYPLFALFSFGCTL